MLKKVKYKKYSSIRLSKQIKYLVAMLIMLNFLWLYAIIIELISNCVKRVTSLRRYFLWPWLTMSHLYHFALVKYFYKIEPFSNLPIEQLFALIATIIVTEVMKLEGKGVLATRNLTWYYYKLLMLQEFSCLKQIVRCNTWLFFNILYVQYELIRKSDLILIYICICMYMMNRTPITQFMK